MIIKKIKKDFTGTVLTKDHSIRGKQFERIMSDCGFNINTGAGADLKQAGVEIKTKDINSGSHHSVGVMTYEDICNKPYEETYIFEKLQKQFRVKTDEGVIVHQDLYDFRDHDIQYRLKQAYETARQKMKAGDKSSYILGSKYGHFDKKTENSWQFRIPISAMKKLETMSKQNFNNIFNYTDDN